MDRLMYENLILLQPNRQKDAEIEDDLETLSIYVDIPKLILCLSCYNKIKNLAKNVSLLFKSYRITFTLS